MSNISQSFQKLYDYIESRKAVDTEQNEQMGTISEKVDELEEKVEENNVQFNVYYNLLEIKKGK